jgi:hypothetical protein
MSRRLQQPVVFEMSRNERFSWLAKLAVILNYVLGELRCLAETIVWLV